MKKWKNWRGIKFIKIADKNGSKLAEKMGKIVRKKINN